MPQLLACDGEIEMTDDEVRREILHAIVECEVEDGRGNPRPAISDIGTAKELRTAVFNALEKKGLLKID
jgi:hypothetical protein